MSERHVLAVRGMTCAHCERAVREGRMTLAESQALRRFYEWELNGYTYLEPD